MKRSLESSIIIHSFAIMHACACVFLLSIGGSDEAILTFLTLTMVILLCRQWKMSLSFTLSCAILSNIAGYIIGLAGAGLYKAVFSDTLLANVSSTFITTEVIGWTLFLISRTQEQKQIASLKQNRTQTFWLLAMLVVLYIARILIMHGTRNGLTSSPDILSTLQDYLMNSPALLLLIAVGIMMSRSLIQARSSQGRKILHLSLLSCFFVLSVIVASLLVTYNIPFQMTRKPAAELFFNSILVGTVLQTFFFVCSYTVGFALNSRTLAKEQAFKAQQAQYLYSRLKQQVNPHFLFNSLNILDALVSENKNEQASTYIRKMASVYRYMLKYEDNTLVTLGEEMDFVNKYVELMKVRFPEGIILSTDIPEGLLSRKVIPCSIQMMVENAFKHNITSSAKPLHLDFSCDSDRLKISNNIQLKANAERNSLGVGLKNIEEQYRNISGQSISVNEDVQNRTFTVTLPLI